MLLSAKLQHESISLKLKVSKIRFSDTNLKNAKQNNYFVRGRFLSERLKPIKTYSIRYKYLLQNYVIFLTLTHRL